MRLPAITVTFCLLAVSTLPATAQFKKGEQFLSGTFTAANSSFSGGDRTTNLNFSPSYTRFTTDRKAWSAKLIFALISGKQTESGQTLNLTNYNIGIGASRQNILPLGGKGFYFSTEYGFNALYVFGEESYEGTGTLPQGARTKGYNLQFNLRPEIGYRLSNRFLVGVNFNDLLLLGFQQVSQERGSAGAETQSTFYLNSALANIALGQIGVRFSVRI